MYGQLPSYIQANATTFDIMVYDVMMSWEEHQQKQAEGKNSAPELSQEQMFAAIERVKKEKNNGR